jgi:predicted DNA-binding WGR domain protein
MIAQPYRLYIERTDPQKNMARFYALSIEPTLFGTPSLTRRWGRIGSRGQVKVHHFEKEADAVLLFLDLLRQKRARGYRAKSEARALGRRIPASQRDLDAPASRIDADGSDSRTDHIAKAVVAAPSCRAMAGRHKHGEAGDVPVAGFALC